MFGYRGPSVDHSLLSNSGRMSKRARAAAEERERIKLFGEQGLQRPQPRQEDEMTRDLRMASELESLADRGMKPLSYRQKAAELRAKWNQAAAV